MSPSTHPGLSKRKRVLFTLIVLLLPLLFGALLEGGLRLVGVGRSVPLFVPVAGYPTYLQRNRDLAQRYFRGWENIPEIPPIPFRAKKTSQTFRIVVQGASSAASFPFHSSIFTNMLQQRLANSFDNREIEVINTAMAAVNSFTLLDLSKEILAQSPDAVLIYAGHNEFYGALGVGSTVSRGRSVRLVRLYLRLQDLRIVQGIRTLLIQAKSLWSDRRHDPSSVAPHTMLMERMAGEREIPLGSPLYQRGLSQYRANLEALLQRYRKAGVPVFVGTLACNERDQAPFTNALSPTANAATWQQHLAAGREAAVRGDLQAALAAFDMAIQLDSLGADAFFEKARALDRAGRHAEAQTAYVAAKDRDVLRFRASEDVNRIVRDAVPRYGAEVVETQEALRRAARNGIIGDDLMTDHLHPNQEGYFLLAEAFYDALLRSSVLGPPTQVVSSATARSQILVTPVDSVAAEYRVRRLKENWPFKPAGSRRSSAAPIRATNVVEQIALDLAETRKDWIAATAALSDHYANQGDFDQALQAARAIAQSLTFHPVPHAKVGQLLLAQGRLDEALRAFETSSARGESAAVHGLIASILLTKGQPNDAMERLRKSLDLEPQAVETLFVLAQTYAAMGRVQEARATLEHLLQLAPQHAEARKLLTRLSAEERG